MNTELELKNKTEALRELGVAEAFLLVTVYEGKTYYRAVVPERYPIQQVQGMIVQAEAGVKEVKTFVQTAVTKGLVKAPANFDPKKVH